METGRRNNPKHRRCMVVDGSGDTAHQGVFACMPCALPATLRLKLRGRLTFWILRPKFSLVHPVYTWETVVTGSALHWDKRPNTTEIKVFLEPNEGFTKCKMLNVFFFCFFWLFPHSVWFSRSLFICLSLLYLCPSVSAPLSLS